MKIDKIIFDAWKRKVERLEEITKYIVPLFDCPICKKSTLAYKDLGFYEKHKGATPFPSTDNFFVSALYVTCVVCGNTFGRTTSPTYKQVKNP